MDNEVKYLSGEYGVTEKIKKAMFNVMKEYLYIGFLLNEAKDNEYYKESNYIDIYDYAYQELGFKRSSVKNFIAVFLEFASRNTYGTPTMYLRDDYKDFKYSQLCEMLSLSEKQRENINPNMTVKEIRQIKHEIKCEPVEPETGQTSGQTTDQVNTVVFIKVNIVKKFIEENERIYNEIFHTENQKMYVKGLVAMAKLADLITESDAAYYTDLLENQIYDLQAK